METAVEPVTLDLAAARKVEDFIANSPVAKDDEGVALRLKVVGGGCAGFQYSLGLDKPKDDDLVFESEGQKVIVDSVSINFVAGSMITYHEEIGLQGFEVLNPRAEAACGCGSSFAFKPDAA